MTAEQKERDRARIAEIERETAEGFSFRMHKALGESFERETAEGVSFQIHKAFGAGFESGMEEGRALALDAERGATSWQRISPGGIYECTKCGQNVFTPDIQVYRYCHGCGRVVREVIK